MQATFTFSARGNISQTVNIINPAYTPERLLRELNSGRLLTTVQENGAVEVTASGKVVATIVSVDNDLEYFDFQFPL